MLDTLENALVIDDMLKTTSIVNTLQFIQFLTDFQFETVAVVRDDFHGTLEALRGKKFCHPGFSESQLWTDRVLKVK
jgi:hypothetical protein